MKAWQREVGKIAGVKKTDRCFVTGEGKVIASDTTNPEFIAYMKKRKEDKKKKLRDSIAKRLKRVENAHKRSIEKQTKKLANKEAQKTRLEAQIKEAEAKLLKL